MNRMSYGLVIAMLASFTVHASCADSPSALADTGPASADGITSQDLSVLGFDANRVLVGFRISPVPLDLHQKSRVLVGVGSYLVNAAGGCNDCHTHPSFAPGGDPYQGQPTKINSDQFLTGGRQFGEITSPNLTPDAQGNPGGLSFSDFKTLMRTGREADEPDKILQIMPWPIYANMVDSELRAIYEYLRAMPSKPNNPNPGP